jgi:internalin A
VPLHVAAMPALAELLLDYNQIAAVPNRLGRCGRLVHLSLAANQLKRLPAAMKDLVALTALDVSNNSLAIVTPEARAPASCPLATRPPRAMMASSFPAGRGADSWPGSCALSLGARRQVGLLPSLEWIDLSGNPLESPPLQVAGMGTAAVSSFLSRIQEMKETGKVNLEHCRLADIPRDVLSFDAASLAVPDALPCAAPAPAPEV